MENNKVVYRHIRNDTNKVFYIGMGTIDRPNMGYGRSKHWNSIVKKGGKTVEVLASNLSIDDANELEMFLISEYGYENLCNKTLGGEGQRGTNHWLGKNHSKKTKEKCRLINLGRKTSDETKQKIREANLGKKRSEESKIKASKNSKNRRQVKDISTGVIYRSISYACRELGLNRNTIISQLNGRKKIQKYNTLRYE